MLNSFIVSKNGDGFNFLRKLRKNVLAVFILFFNIILIYSNGFAYDIRSYSEIDDKIRNSLNLVLCSLNYQNSQDFQKDIEVLIQKLKKTKPFDEFDSFGLWYIKLSKKEESKIFKPTEGFPPLKVRQNFLRDILNHLKANYKLIIIDASGSTSCAELSSLDKTSLIILGKTRYKDENSFAKGFLHELGHSFGLRDECIDCEQICPAGKPNCARDKEEAERLWGDLIGKDSRVNYIAGCCGNRDYIRPTIASLMNDADKAEDFGPVNERYLRKIILEKESE